jgi:hypothetical protein
MAVLRGLVGALFVIGLSAACWAAAGLDQLAQQIVTATQTPDSASFIADNFSKDVAAKLAPSGEGGGSEAIDFDVFTYSQDPDYDEIKKTIKNVVSQADDANAVIHVTFTQYGADETAVDYHLKKSGERWLIDDVVYPNDNFSVRSALGLK